MTRTHLITGVTGQDGVLLARHLVSLGEQVVGTVTYDTDPRAAIYLPEVTIEVLDIRSTSAFADLVSRHRPDVVHNLAALSSVGASWDAPSLTDEVNHQAVLGMLSVIGESGIDFIQASSSEIYGPVREAGPGERPVDVDEDTALNPVSPYAEAKAHAHLAVAEARTAGARSTNLVLFGHTSPLHHARFVLPTITRQAAATALGQCDGVSLRDPSVTRDWGSAADFVRAFALAVRAPYGEYVIATGATHCLADVAAWALEAAGVTDPAHASGPGSASGVAVRASGEAARPNDFGGVRGDYRRARTNLGWWPQTTLQQTVAQMVYADLARLRTGVEDSPAYLET